MTEFLSIVNNIPFTIKMDVDSLSAQMKSVIDDITEYLDPEDWTRIKPEQYSEAYMTRYANPDNDNLWKFKEKVEEFLVSLKEKPQEFADQVATEMAKKKNGEFKINSVLHVFIADGFGMEWQDSYCTAYPSITAKADESRNCFLECRYYQDKY